MVTYKDVPEFPGYRVGDDGSVWSCWDGPRGQTNEWRPMRPWIGKGDGWSSYYRVSLSRQGKVKSFAVHALVLLAFVGPRPPGLVGCHGDTDRKNNRLENLRWDTYKANSADSLHKTARGERHYRSRLTESDIPVIARMSKEGRTQKAIAEHFKVSGYAVFAVIHGETWRHVSREAA